MYFNIDNPYGTALYPTPEQVRIKPHKLPRTRKGVRALRSPLLPSVVLKNFLLS